MLKAIVDETSHGKYDFMYLRIGGLISQLKQVDLNRLTPMPSLQISQITASMTANICNAAIASI